MTDFLTLHPALSEILTLLLAASLGAGVAFQPRSTDRDLTAVRSATFLGVAGALMMIVVEGELARAFGLVGAASIVRYRYGLRNGRDATSLILALGVGMACGAGLPQVAVLGAVVVALLNWIFSAIEVRRGGLGRELEVEVRVWNADADGPITDLLRRLGLNPRFVEVEGKEPKDRNGEGAQYRYIWGISLPPGADPIGILKELRSAGFSEVRLRDPPADRNA